MNSKRSLRLEKVNIGQLFVLGTTNIVYFHVQVVFNDSAGSKETKSRPGFPERPNQTQHPTLNPSPNREGLSPLLLEEKGSGGMGFTT